MSSVTYDAAALALLARYARPERLARMDEVLAHRTRYVTSVFEHMYQPHNVHACLRSLECQGVQHATVIDGYQVFNRQTSVSRGAGYWLDVSVYRPAGDNPAAWQASTQEALATLRAQGYALYSADFCPGAYTPETVPLDRPLALIVGTEQAGISAYTKSQVDGAITIPMSGFTQSYNVSVALSIIMYTITRRMQHEVGARAYMTQQEKDHIKLQWLRAEIKSAAALEQRFLTRSEHGTSIPFVDAGVCSHEHSC